jgi:hypothetical protein
MRFVSLAAATVCLISAGCGHDQLPWPPTPADVERINKAAQEENGYIRIEYVEAIAPPRSARVVRPIRIESVDDHYIEFRTAAGDVQPVSAAIVRGITVKDRDRGGLIGLGLGVVVGAAITAGVWMLESSGGSQECTRCSDARGIGVAVAIPAFIGLVVGYAVSGRRTFDLGAGR